LSTVLDIVDKSVKVAAVLIAGTWAYLNYLRGRTFKRRLEPQISGNLLCVDKDWFVCGEAQLKNVGLSKVTIEQKGTAIVVEDLVVAKDSKDSPAVFSDEVAVLEVFKTHKWLEPGETVKESFLTLLPSDRNRIAVRLGLRVVSHDIEWNADSIAEIA